VQEHHNFSLFLRLLYRFLRFIVLISMRVFYKKTVLLNQKNTNPTGPCVFVSNHPSTLLDPFNAVLYLEPEVFFLANAGLFKHPFVDWLLRKLYCIPVRRKKDNNPNVVNEKAFDHCEDFLTKGGFLYVAIEGSSYMERHLRELKTGTARIVFGAEAKSNFELGINIVPIGLTYDNVAAFRGNVVIDFGTPIYVKDFQADYQQNEEDAVDKLTDAIRAALLPLMVHTNDNTEERLLEKIETLQQSEQPVSVEAAYYRTKETFLPLLRSLSDTQSTTLTQHANSYWKQLEKYQILDKNVWNYSQKQENRFLFLAKIIFFILGFPLFLWGYLNNVLTALSAKWFITKFNGYDPTVRYLCGFFLTPLFYWGLSNVWNCWIDFPYFKLFFWISAALCGVFAWDYRKIYQQWCSELRFWSLEEKVKKELVEGRKEVVYFPK
jgi:glycerol-3-phosphate O-acyltransferase / dihydroxyacetone phosphate acyltransferase